MHSNFHLAVDTREGKRMRVWEAKSIQCSIADRFEECNTSLITETIQIYDFVFASGTDHNCFICS